MEAGGAPFRGARAEPCDTRPGSAVAEPVTGGAAVFASYDPTHTGFVAEIDGCRCCIEGIASPIADQIDWRWTISIAQLDNLDGMDPDKFDVLATGETVTPLQASQQIVAWLDAHPPEDDELSDGADAPPPHAG